MSIPMPDQDRPYIGCERWRQMQMRGSLAAGLAARAAPAARAAERRLFAAVTSLAPSGADPETMAAAHDRPAGRAVENTARI